MATQSEIARVASDKTLSVQTLRITTYLAATGTGIAKLKKIGPILDDNQGATLPEIKQKLSEAGLPGGTIVKFDQYVAAEKKHGHRAHEHLLSSDKQQRFHKSMLERSGLDSKSPSDTFTEAAAKRESEQRAEFNETGKVEAPALTEPAVV